LTQCLRGPDDIGFTSRIWPAGLSLETLSIIHKLMNVTASKRLMLRIKKKIFLHLQHAIVSLQSDEKLLSVFYSRKRSLECSRGKNTLLQKRRFFRNILQRNC